MFLKVEIFDEDEKGADFMCFHECILQVWLMYSA
eukprot:gene26879-biopygen17464